jgi:N-methylhydantoinase B
MQGVYRPLSGDMTVAYCSDGDVNAPRGVLGGLDGARALNAKRTAGGGQAALPAFHMETVRAGESVVFRTVSGGGYGDARKRDPERVARDVNRGWIDAQVARETYRVAVVQAQNGIDFVVDNEATARLRNIRQEAID